MFYKKSPIVSRAIGCLTVFLLATSLPLFADEHTVSNQFDITIEAANQFMATAYYSDFASHFSGSYTAAGAFETNLTMHQPTEQNVNIYEGNLYAELVWNIAGNFTLDDQNYSFDRSVSIRLGLRQDQGLKFGSTQIQFLDQSLPWPIQGIIQREIEQKLMQVHGFLATTANIINALPTITLNLESSSIAYKFWIDRPLLEIVFNGPPVPGNEMLKLNMRMHAILEADVPGFGKLNKRYDLELSPTASIDYKITDTTVDAVVGQVNDFIRQLPRNLRDRVRQELEHRRIPVYEGRLIDIVNELTPEEVALEIISIAISVTLSGGGPLLPPRVTIGLAVTTSSESPSFRLTAGPSPTQDTPVNIFIRGNVKALIRELKIYNINGGTVRDLTGDELVKHESEYEFQGRWDLRNNNGQEVASGSYYICALVDNLHNLYALKSPKILVVK